MSRAKDWQRFEEVSLVLAGLATTLVLSVHTIVSLCMLLCNSRMAYHYFPPFCCGQYSGFAMNTLLLFMRKVSNLEAYITLNILLN
jgi:molybdopterin-containing oxidoreductase family membrane subunit